MDRKEFYQARHDFRAAVRDFIQRHGIMADGWDRFYGKLYRAAPKEVQNAFKRCLADSYTDSLHPSRGWTPRINWQTRCQLLPNSYPRKTKNP